MTRRTTTYLVTDIEADGLVLGRHSMISIGSVAVDRDGDELSRFEINLEPADGMTQDPDAMAWWATQPEAWAEVNRDPVAPGEAMRRFADWARGHPGELIFAAHPLWFDGGYVGWYLERYLDLALYDRPRERGLTVAGLDLQSLAMGVLGWDRQDCGRHRYPAEWLAGHEHTHRAIDDALGYAGLLRHLLALGVAKAPDYGSIRHT